MSLGLQTDLKHISKQINKNMSKIRVKREPFDEKILLEK